MFEAWAQRTYVGELEKIRLRFDGKTGEVSVEKCLMWG